MSLFYNVKGSSVSGGQATTELVPPGVDYDVESLLLVNIHDSAVATITLFIQNDPIDTTSNTYEIVHNVVIPSGATLVFEQPVTFNVPGDYGLYITVGSSDTVDVTINT